MWRFPLIFWRCANRTAEAPTCWFAHVDMQHSQHSLRTDNTNRYVYVIIMAEPQYDNKHETWHSLASIHKGPRFESLSVFLMWSIPCIFDSSFFLFLPTNAPYLIQYKHKTIAPQLTHHIWCNNKTFTPLPMLNSQRQLTTTTMQD